MTSIDPELELARQDVDDRNRIELHHAITELTRHVAELARGVLHEDYPALALYREENLSNGVTLVRGAPGEIVWWHVVNAGAADAFLHLFDDYVDHAIVGDGLSKPKLSLLIPAGGGLDSPVPKGIGFKKAISVAASTTKAGGAAPASALLVNIATKPLTARPL